MICLSLNPWAGIQNCDRPEYRMSRSGECHQLGISDCLPGKCAPLPCCHIYLSLYARGIAFGMWQVFGLYCTAYGNVRLLGRAVLYADRATEVLDLLSLLDVNIALANPLLQV